MNQDLSCSVGQELDRASPVVSVRILIRRSTNESCHNSMSQLFLPSRTKIRHTGQRDRVNNPRLTPFIERRSLQYFVATDEPECEVATGRVTHDQCPRHVNTRIFIENFWNLVRGEADVLKSRRPIATWIPNSSIFNIACDDSPTCQVCAQGSSVLQIVS